MKLTKRNFKKKVDRPLSTYHQTWQQVESLPIEGKRYPLEAGRIIKVKGERGIHKVMSVVQHKDTGAYEVHTYWQSTKQLTPATRGQLRCIRLEHIKHITGEVT